MRSGGWSQAAVRLAILCIWWGSPVAAGVESTPAYSSELAVPGRANATPAIAAEDDVVVVAWGASLPSGATDVFVALSRDRGRTFGAPSRVNDVEGDARLTGEQPPRITLAGRIVNLVWTAKGANGTRLLQSRSSDGGRTFAKATIVPGADAPGNRGWENTAVDRRGRVFAVWLDHRELARQDAQVASGHHEHMAGTTPAAGGRPDGVAMAQQSKLFIGSLDAAIAPRAITGGVCYCCKTAIAVGPDGAIYSAWRHVYPGNIRDIAFSVSRDGGRTFAAPARVSEDKWVLEGCPDDGPAMAVDAVNRVHIVWPTLVNEGGDDTIALFYATFRGSEWGRSGVRPHSDPTLTPSDGASFTPRQRIPTSGMPHHPQIAIAADGKPVIAWDEGAAGRRVAAIAHIGGPSPRSVFTREVLADAAVYPVIAPVGDRIVAAWTSGKSAASVIRIEVRQ